MKKIKHLFSLIHLACRHSRRLWLILFLWMSISQSVVAHEQLHSIETDNACLVCFAQSQLNSSTLHSNQIQIQQSVSDFQIISNLIIFQDTDSTPFSSRDPPA
jgi:hypothetical protein